MALLSDEDIRRGIEGTNWRHEGGALVRQRRFPEFADAVAFVNRVAQAAEAAGHHPDVLLHGYSQVRLTLTTHSAGGVTNADLELARELDRL